MTDDNETLRIAAATEAHYADEQRARAEKAEAEVRRLTYSGGSFTWNGLPEDFTALPMELGKLNKRAEKAEAAAKQNFEDFLEVVDKLDVAEAKIRGLEFALAEAVAHKADALVDEAAARDHADKAEAQLAEARKACGEAVEWIAGDYGENLEIVMCLRRIAGGE